MGIKLDNLSIDIATMQQKKESVVKGLTSGIEALFKMNKVDYKKGTASFVTPLSIKVEPIDGSESTEISAKNFIIATGSEASPMPGGGDVVADEDLIITSTGALVLQKAPKKMIVIGGETNKQTNTLQIVC